MRDILTWVPSIFIPVIAIKSELGNKGKGDGTSEKEISKTTRLLCCGICEYKRPNCSQLSGVRNMALPLII